MSPAPIREQEARGVGASSSNFRIGVAIPHEIARARCRQHGFTVMELIIVILVIGVLAASVFASFSGLDQQRVVLQADLLRRDLSHLQLMAISQRQRLWLFVAADGSGYYVCNSSNCTGANVIDPATRENFAVTLPGGVTLAASPGGSLEIDGLGRPSSGAVLISAVPAKMYTLSGADRQATVRVNPITGFATANY